MALYCNSPHLLVETDEEGLSSSSMRKSPNNRRNTVSSFPCTDEWCDPTEKELRRQSMNSFLIKPRVKLEEQQEKQEPNALFCHLSREELIQRVVQLEREKQLNSKLSGKTNKGFFSVVVLLNGASNRIHRLRRHRRRLVR